MRPRRALRHLLLDQWSVRRAFPATAMRAIRNRIREKENRHGGELRFAVEASLPLYSLWRDQDARARAVEVFAHLRIWDTEHNNGVLIYLLLADKRVEIVADRGISAKVGESAWVDICRGMQRSFAQGQFESGAIAGIDAVGDLLARHYPRPDAQVNELSDDPVIL